MVALVKATSAILDRILDGVVRRMSNLEFERYESPEGRSVRCPNPWHASAPARRDMACPECVLQPAFGSGICRTCRMEYASADGAEAARRLHDRCEDHPFQLGAE